MKPSPLRWSALNGPALFFLGALLVTVAGFWPSFFSKLDRVTPTDLLHGWSASGWLALTVVQACLIGAGRRQLHRCLGHLSAALALSVVITGFFAVQSQTLRNLEEIRLYRYMFNVSNLTQLVTFSAFLVMGIFAARRGAFADHARFMMGTSLIVLPPAVERLWAIFAPGLVAADYGITLYLSIVSVQALLVVLIIADWRRGKIYPQFPVIFAIFAMIMLAAKPVAESSWFQSFSHWFAAA